MDCLPSYVTTIDDSFGVVRRFDRVYARDDEKDEKDYDRLIVERKDELADALRQAGMLDEGSSLLILGTQITGIDVLMAEVGPSQELRRLVLVEDKLFKNPEAKRQVLSQVLDYARRMQEELTVDELEAQVIAKRPDQRAWLDQNRAALERAKGVGDFLLIVSGDGIRRELLDLVAFTRRRLGPQCLAELCLVSMGVYRVAGGTERLLVPCVVGLVTRAERDMAVRVAVTVTGTDGRPVCR